MATGAVILAAGLSSRMAPLNKLLELLDGRPVIRHVVQAALDAPLDPVTVVIAPDREALLEVFEGLPLRVVVNDGHQEGLASSIRTGVSSIMSDVDAAAFLLGDMPLIAPRHLRSLIAAFAPARGLSICIPTYATERGNPVLWGAQHFPRLLKLQGDQGARVLFRDLADQIAEVEMPDDAVLWDIDTQASLDAVRTRFAPTHATLDFTNESREFTSLRPLDTKRK